MSSAAAPFDVLSDVLRTAAATAHCSVSLIAGGEWSISFPVRHLKFHTMRHGYCWLVVDGQEPVRLRSGDSLIVAASRFALMSRLGLPATALREVLPGALFSARLGEGEDVSVLGGTLELDPIDATLVKTALPPVLVLPAGSVPAVDSLVEALGREWDAALPGAQLTCDDLMRLVVVQALRTQIAEDAGDGPGWLTGLADPRIARALGAIHARPGKPWTVELLAAQAGQSRSSFSALFRARVGMAPIDYLTAWRMRLAARQLRLGDKAVGSIAASLGYTSDSAFSAAFRRAQGSTPAQYRRHHGALEPEPEMKLVPSAPRLDPKQKGAAAATPPKSLW